ncbi:hypothetical protein [Dyadobacter sandarakinus]|uniref:Uncharacterized protein n=1 Tax=Dyadobacter sandarakinus TaxID=2747268 RepID=A0ABX7IAS5_9BACT|nr:hypothetical protein [Dyadobacter sandarakinus]QRR03229.1 hypothetical protein HWI92_21085 [Dyadobacter sandarakinus]
MKLKTPTYNSKSENLNPDFTHAPEEVLLAGGAMVFGKKTGKNNASMINALQNNPSTEPFSSAEWDALMHQLDQTK